MHPRPSDLSRTGAAIDHAYPATDPDRGLTGDEARARRVQDGPNSPSPVERPAYGRLVLRQLRDPLVALLIAAAAFAAASGDSAEAIAVGAIVVVNTLLGFWQESRAEQAIRALAESFTQTARVVRDGAEVDVVAADVVRGDILVLAEGDRVAADARLLSATALEADESALTGESLPVGKRPEASAATVPLAERTTMVHAGTSVTRGRARAVVSAIGADTEMGHIAVLAAHAPPPPTPLSRRLGRLARTMALMGAVITCVLFAVMLLRGSSVHDAFLTGVAVAVAAVPEGLAATVTTALALGAHAMARQGAIVRRLAAIETLGETSVICTDKTGTLTQNRIRLVEILPAADVSEAELLGAALLASGPPGSGAVEASDPIDAALFRVAGERGQLADLGSAGPVHETPFDAERRRMTRVWRDGSALVAYTKGAPETVAERLGAADHPLLEVAAERAGRGWRVLAVARRLLPPETVVDDDADAGGELTGLLCFEDPLRPESAGAVHAATRAGIEVRMVTGDHPAAARTIGRALGLADDAILARATPADKLELVEALQERGETVAVTGDGVNDAPALRRADVGVAMGRDGTEAARQAAAVVLTDDDFATIVAAVAEGRRIGDNIRRFVGFLLSANLGEVVAFTVAVIAGLGPPLSIVQVLIVNFVTDGAPAVALAREPADAATMQRPPRREAQLFDRSGWRRLVVIGLLVGAVTIAAFELGRAFDGDAAQTMAFATLALAELALVYAFRAGRGTRAEGARSPWLTASVVGSLAVLAAALYVPGLHEPLATVSLSVAQAAVVVGLALLPLGIVRLAWRS